MLLTNYKDYPQEDFHSYFKSALVGASCVRIASGYVGQDVFIAQIPLLKEVLQEGGVVQLIFGISLWEGVTEKCEAAMREFHDFASANNNESGVFIVRTSRYHGKIYHYEYSEFKDPVATVGSSNFSPTGFGRWRETNIVVNDSVQLTKLGEFFDRLKTNDTVPITLIPRFGGDKKVRLTLREKDNRHIDTFSWPANNAVDIEKAKKLPVAFRLPIRTGPRFEKSSLNVFNGPGRKQTNGKYAVRGWYEVENTIKKGDQCKQELNKYLPATLEPYRFQVVTDDNQVFEVNFNRKYGERGNKCTLQELGVDFQSSKRRILGYFIKDRLVNAGVLGVGDTITPDTLDDYGADEIVFRDLGNNHFYMTF